MTLFHTLQRLYRLTWKANAFFLVCVVCVEPFLASVPSPYCVVVQLWPWTMAGLLGVVQKLPKRRNPHTVRGEADIWTAVRWWHQGSEVVCVWLLSVEQFIYNTNVSNMQINKQTPHVYFHQDGLYVPGNLQSSCFEYTYERLKQDWKGHNLPRGNVTPAASAEMVNVWIFHHCSFPGCFQSSCLLQNSSPFPSPLLCHAANLIPNTHCLHLCLVVVLSVCCRSFRGW